MAESTGPGKFFIKLDSLTKVLRIWLFNYDVDATALKHEHTELLVKGVGPLIRDGGNIKLLGLASTTGSVKHDQDLGEGRAAEVHSFLTRNFGGKFAVSKEISFGKEMALQFGIAKLPGGTADHKEAELWRGVVINAWSRSTPPPPPIGVDIPINNSTWADSLDKVLNGANIALGIVDLGADLFELAGLAAVTGPLGLALSSILAIIGMPLLWSEVDALANTNGQIQGAGDAMQDMADQFSSDSLDSTPLSKWPAVRVPELHFSGNPQPNAFQQAWIAGQRVGLKNALQVVLDMEQNPKPVTLASGKHIRMSGRLWLRALSKAFGDNVSVKTVVEPANAEFQKRGKPPFPTH